MSRATEIHAQQFARCARSPEWKAGALRGLRLALDEPVADGLPYPAGTAQYDAWQAGIEAGRAEGKWQLAREFA